MFTARFKVPNFVIPSKEESGCKVLKYSILYSDSSFVGMTKVGYYNTVKSQNTEGGNLKLKVKK
jgi:hypothetical protein